MPEPANPYRNFNFTLQIQGIEQAHFTECLGLGVRVHPIRYRESGAGQIVRALTGPVEYAELVLRYGVTTSTDMWQWLVQSMRGTAQRRNVSVIMLQDDGATEGDRWNLANAWPCEWRGAALDAIGREAAIEEMRLVFYQL